LVDGSEVMIMADERLQHGPIYTGGQGSSKLLEHRMYDDDDDDDDGTRERVPHASPNA
jgi:hypothetical protein